MITYKQLHNLMQMCEFKAERLKKKMFLFPPSTTALKHISFIPLADTPTVLDRKKKRCGSASLDMHPVTSNTTNAEECDLL